ncbi:N-acetylglucosamine-6-phosphate deacetylase [Alicyclobacillus ferrooxydans]|uniref:N-acetylglucosamine-6-phosphate deacetylase n=1 Tax=Alicyclobacillus ferrooxydans TaxID=471514 RepID=A0A0P9EJF0_9BACL|nr:N-acetylglucosamine-6-phosphate deacetylase [Alicyclobacillus ferrooxydans]KPV43086.1 hypothetical protein AN477_14220 [Alicyclobacillus ferrooxydans]
MQRFEGNRVGPDGSIQTIVLEVNDGQIQSVKTYDQVDETLPFIVPGFIDVHVHGGGGADTMDATNAAFSTIAQSHAKTGTTSLLLTTVTESVDAIDKVVTLAQEFIAAGAEVGAGVIGVHLEGPFIHPEKRGAQRQDMIIDPDPVLASRWFDSGVVKMITMAPERPHALEVARLAMEQGIVVAAGHTKVGSEGLYAAGKCGFSHITHLCNAMDPFLHRNVGPVGHIIEDEGYTGDMICDGIHLSAAMVKALVRSIGTHRLMLITDAMRAANFRDGKYDLGGLQVSVENGECRLEDGTLAGSVLTMARAYKMVQKLAGITAREAEQMASTNPARKIGLDKKGRIKVGYDADLAFLDNAGDVIRTVVGGKIVFEKSIQAKS